MDNTITIEFGEAPNHFKGGVHNIEWNNKPIKSDWEHTAEGYKLFDELIIYEFRQLRRIDEKGTNDILSRYNITP